MQRIKLLLILPVILLLIFSVSAYNSYLNINQKNSVIKIYGFRLLDNEKYTLVYNNSCILNKTAYSSMITYCDGKCGFLEIKYKVPFKKKFDLNKFYVIPSKDVVCNKFKILNRGNIV